MSDNEINSQDILNAIDMNKINQVEKNDEVVQKKLK